MSDRWYVVKHVPDLMRREPRNVGVVLYHADGAASRFIGEGDDGEIDGRSVGQFGNHLVYKAWVRQWRSLRDAGPAAMDEAVLRGRPPGASFYIEDGGERLVGDDGRSREDAIEELFATLVRQDAAPPVADNVRALARRVFLRLGIVRTVREGQSLSIGTAGEPDELWFDYRYDNGRPHLMQRVGLSGADRSTWDRLHLVEATFSRLAESKPTSSYGRVALIRQQDADTRLIRAVNGRLKGLATVIDVGQEAEAASQLGESLHLKIHRGKEEP